MKTRSTPAFIISGTSSGSGKTTVALGLMAAFKNKGYTVQPFKCGPDLIDPGLHKLVTGKVSRNLDVWMCGEDYVRSTYHNNACNADIGIIEGVMGMFDGGSSSSGALARVLQIPGILVLDVRSMAESAAAIVKGFESFLPDVAPKGVILNRIGSDRHLQLVSDAIRENCQVEILGHLPRTIEFSIPSRHLGLLTGDESPINEQGIELLAKTVTDHINLERIIEICSDGDTYPTQLTSSKKSCCRIGVARDKAFCFYYEDNFDLLRAAGAELVFFSPLNDTVLPDNLDGIYLGGGYPELYAKQLSDNHSMIDALHNWIENDGPVYAECGGFMYLTQGITDHDNCFHPMVGCFPVKSHMQKKRASLGYREIKTVAASIFGPSGTIMRGHEFHYSNIDEMATGINRIYAVNNNTREGYSYRKVLGGYMHLHFGYSPQVAENLVKFCRE
jgi:cobyrinic acid a,c-diamide synthase